MSNQVAAPPLPIIETEEDLMLAYVGGDAAAFRRLFARLAPMIAGMARRRLRNDAEAQDVAQQTFLQLHRARHDFRPGMRLRPWVVTIAMNLARDLLRRRSRWLAEEVPDHLAAAGPSPAEALDRAVESRRARAAVALLPVEQRELIERRWFREENFEEIATALGTTQGAARVRSHRAVRTLRALLAA